MRGCVRGLCLFPSCVVCVVVGVGDPKFTSKLCGQWAGRHPRMGLFGKKRDERRLLSLLLADLET